MTTTPTQNPVPSEAAVDLKFNAGKIDEFVTSFVLKYTDRLGRDHLTIEGIRDLVEKAIKEFGFVTMDSFEDGATLDNSSQVLRWESNGEYYRWDGSFPKVVPVRSTPASTGGLGVGAWVSVGDAALRGQLASEIIGSGDALVAVKQPFTGAEARTQHDKNQDIVTFEDFGAVGDGITDDTAAIQKAIDSGARYITSSDGPLKTYIINSPILISRNKVHINLHKSEIKTIGNISHFKIGYQNHQIYDISLNEIIFICDNVTSGYALDIKNVGLLSVSGSTFYGDGKMYSCINLNCTTITSVEKNRFSGCISNAMVLTGLNNTTLRCVDTTIYDNRIENCGSGIFAGDFSEGIFIRRNIIYATLGSCISISPSSIPNGLGSIKIQDNDIDSYGFVNLTSGGIYIKNSKNIQVTGN